MKDAVSVYDLPTPALLADMDRVKKNLADIQAKARGLGLKLRPHIKTHRMPYFAKMQIAAGACGIACAKIGEAEVMAENGIDDIFIANEVVGIDKYERLRRLHGKIKVRIGIDNEYQLKQMEAVFDSAHPLEVLVEYEVGEVRSGVVGDEQLISLVKKINASKCVNVRGIFSHEGHTYKAADIETCVREAKEAYRRTVRAADIMRELGCDIDTVSVGATPSFMSCDEFEGVTEIRIGTYIFFDVGQSNALGSFDRCAATVLASVISKPTEERVVLDSGAKALVSQNRPTGICSTNGFGCVKNAEHISVANLFDEHAVINSKELNESVQVGDKIEIIPSHICPTVNLYDTVYAVSNGRVLGEIPVLCRGKSV